jgi:hypothetical protein
LFLKCEDDMKKKEEVQHDSQGVEGRGIKESVDPLATLKNFKVSLRILSDFAITSIEYSGSEVRRNSAELKIHKRRTIRLQKKRSTRGEFTYRRCQGT